MKHHMYLKVALVGICILAMAAMGTSGAFAARATNYTITVSFNQGGTITPAGPVVTVREGRNSNFTINPNSGYHVADVLVDGVSVGAVTSYRFRNVRANHTIAASFAASPSGGGFTRPLVSVTFDDSWESQYANALPVLTQYDIVSTLYTVTSYVEWNYDDFMTLSQLREFKSGGHEIASHTVTHPDLTTLSPAELDAELANSKAWLEANGLGPVYDFACPYGEYNATTIAATKNYYISNREGYSDEGDDTNTISNLDPYRIRVKEVTLGTTASEIASWLAQASAEKSWVVLMYHQIDNSGGEWSTTPQAFQAHVQAIQASGVAAVTVKQALDELLPQAGK
jgi:peptidoglycan/xylan/chitin deacetylase (PgdA/CDA1 family)